MLQLFVPLAGKANRRGVLVPQVQQPQIALANGQVPATTAAAAAGFLSWVAWRSAYLTRLGTIRARMQVAFDWTITLL
jgi:NADH dehydrogenase FAD-containing subunit